MLEASAMHACHQFQCKHGSSHAQPHVWQGAIVLMSLWTIVAKQCQAEFWKSLKLRLCAPQAGRCRLLCNRLYKRVMDAVAPAAGCESQASAVTELSPTSHWTKFKVLLFTGKKRSSCHMARGPATCEAFAWHMLHSREIASMPAASARLLAAWCSSWSRVPGCQTSY